MNQARKSVAFLGDSITWLGGDDCSNRRGWTYWFKNKYQPSAARSFARSGATWSHTESTECDTLENVGIISDNNVISTQIIRLENAVKNGYFPIPEIILIASGTNDGWFPDKRPLALCIDTATTETVSGAIYSDIRRLKQSFPNSKIVLLSPLQSIHIPSSTLLTLDSIIGSAAFRLGVDVIFQDRECAIDSITEKKTFLYTYDGTHPSAEGARLIGESIAERIIEISQ